MGGKMVIKKLQSYDNKKIVEKVNEIIDFLNEKFKEKKSSKYYCEKCGKRIPITVPPYKRHITDMCKCPENQLL